MQLFTFRGGVHPYEGKELTKDEPIRLVHPKRDLVYPLSQHVGAPAIPIVKIGESVLAGQLIAKADGFLSSPIYASVSGTVKNIVSHRKPDGQMAQCIVIENDGTYQETEYGIPASIEELSPEEIRLLIQNAGIVGLGGAGFPTHAKLTPKDPDAIEYVIANCAECEPYLTSDYRKMIETPEELIQGLKIVLRLFPKAKGILAVEDNKVDCAVALEKLLHGDRKIEVKVLKTKYPQGSERQLIYAATGRAIHAGMLPSDVGCIVHNVDTLCAISQAVTKGRPLLEKTMTITGDAIAKPCNLKVPLGTNYLDLVEEAGGFKEEPEKMISGGPMMGIAIHDLDVPVIKTSSALLCMTLDEVSVYEPSACISCGKCAQVCPGRVIPAKLAKFSENQDKESFIKWNGMECCECGCCSFICPAKRHLTQSIKMMRHQILEDRRK